MKRRKFLVPSFMAGVVLSACGGGGGGYGGGGGGGSMNLSSAPGESALVAFLGSSHQYTLTATNAGNTFTAKLSNAPNAGTTTFNGSAPAYSTVQTVTLDANGALVANSITTVYYLLNPYMDLGSVSNTGSPYAIVTTFSPLPATVTVGGSGGFETVTYYHDSTKTVLDADETITYTVSANDSTTLFVCLDSTISNVTAQGMADHMANGTESDCYTVDAAGTAALDSITLMVNGTTLTFM